MRLSVVLIAASLLSGCTATVLAEPLLQVSPYLALYQLRGETKMQSPGNLGGAPQNNPHQNLRDFGQERFREDIGLRVDLGDGFGGLRADYYRLDMNTSQATELDFDWGQLRSGDVASIYAEMDEVRLGYVEPFADFVSEYRDEELRLRLGAGGVLSTRQMNLRGREGSRTRSQNLEIKGERLFVALRAQASWQQLTLDFEAAISPDAFALSGDLDELAHDIEAQLSYQLPQRDIKFFAGVRYSRFSASGGQQGFAYDSDLIVNGLQLGLLITL